MMLCVLGLARFDREMSASPLWEHHWASGWSGPKGHPAGPFQATDLFFTPHRPHHTHQGVCLDLVCGWFVSFWVRNESAGLLWAPGDQRV